MIWLAHHKINLASNWSHKLKETIELWQAINKAEIK